MTEYKEAASGTYPILSPEVVKMSENLVFELPGGSKVMFRKVVFAHWVEKGGNLVECSNCKQEMNTWAGCYTWLSYCPKCGAPIERGLRK